MCGPLSMSHSPEDLQNSEATTKMTKSVRSTFGESRKVRKPLMEKRRRARINQSLNELKKLLLLNPSCNNKIEGSRAAKLEKADILEMTVEHLQRLHGDKKCDDDTDGPKFRAGFRACAREARRLLDRLNQVEPTVRERLSTHLSACLDSMEEDRRCQPADSTQTEPVVLQTPTGLTLLPTKLPNGDLAFVIPADLKRQVTSQNDRCQNNKNQNASQRSEDTSVWRPW